MSQIISPEQIRHLELYPQALSHISRAEAIEKECLIFDDRDKTISLLTTNNFPQIYHQIVDIYKKKGYNINSFFTDSTGFSEALDRYDAREQEKERLFQEHQERIHAEGQGAIELLKKTCDKRATYSEGGFLEEILRLSYQAGASDVHFQAEEEGVSMRLRIDGILEPICVFTHEEFGKYLMKIKFMAGAKMNIVGHSQDGRFQSKVIKDDETAYIDIRASFLPVLRGESIVLRYLDETAGIASLSSLGMQPWHVKTISEQLKKHHGLILVAGPTGSGKTTTVYSLLHQLNTQDKKIITLEDPVEYEIAGITQSQINEAAGYTFEEGLKGILRHDPDIIVVGEMRTLASAQLAINAAITGHLVISTIHTNTAVEAVSRLLNMGIPPFMLTAAVNCIIAQRLVRKAVKPTAIGLPDTMKTYVNDLQHRFTKLLPDEKFPYQEEIYSHPVSSVSLAEGYAGRIGIFECITINQDLKQAILDGQTTIGLQKLVDKQGFLSMEDDGRLKMFEKITTLEEIERVV